MIHQHQATVTQITPQTADSVSLTLQADDPSAFNYEQGQNITLIKTINGEELRRSYSICASVGEQQLRVGIKQIENGRFSTWANQELKVGDKIDLLPPTGHFNVALDPKQQRHHVGIAAGSGITPILSILKTTLEQEPNSSFTLIYGNKTTEDIMFLEELEGLKNHYLERLRIFYILSRETQNAELLNGRIDADKIQLFLQTLLPANTVDEVFLCGPYSMVMGAQQSFTDSGLDSKQIHTELFGTPDDLQALTQESPRKKLSEEELKQVSQLQVIVDGKGTDIQLARGGESILDAALKVRKSLPFACKGGVCATCRAKVIEGEVEMEVNYSLSKEEVEQGYILTCQSHPKSDKVVVSFDEQ